MEKKEIYISAAIISACLLAACGVRQPDVKKDKAAAEAYLREQYPGKSFTFTEDEKNTKDGYVPFSIKEDGDDTEYTLYVNGEVVTENYGSSKIDETLDDIAGEYLKKKNIEYSRVIASIGSVTIEGKRKESAEECWKDGSVLKEVTVIYNDGYDDMLYYENIFGTLQRVFKEDGINVLLYVKAYEDDTERQEIYQNEWSSSEQRTNFR